MKRKSFYRKKLPHFQTPGQLFFVTWIIKDKGKPPQKLFLKNDLRKNKKNITGSSETGTIDFSKIFESYDKYLNTVKSGKHYLKDPVIAEIVSKSIHFWDDKKIDLYCYTIMSNHVHAIFQVYEKGENGDVLFLQDVMKSIKNYSAREINKILKRKGQFWEHESYDRVIRDRKELYYTINYVLENPVKAGYCNNWYDWEWSYIKPELKEYTERDMEDR